jgi:hypothetical protein
MTAPTAKQLAYLRVLLAQAGLGDERYLGSWAKKFGLTMRERQGRIDQADSVTVSKLIDALKEQAR